MDISALRAQTPGCAGRIHLNNAGAALMSQPTLDTMTAYLRREAEIGGYEAAAEARDTIAATYAAVAELVGGRSQEIALFDNATHAWNAAFYSVPLRPGDQILTGHAEYGSNVLAYWQAARRTGAEVAVVPNDEYGQLDVAALERLAGERTALIGVSHVPTGGGLVQPAAAIGRIARGCGALFLLDATQSAGQFPVNVDAIGCDMLTGTGVNVSPTVPEHNPLDTQDRAVHPLIRFSPHYYNTDDEIDRTTELVAGLAGLPMSPAAMVRPHRDADTRGERVHR